MNAGPRASQVGVVARKADAGGGGRVDGVRNIRFVDGCHIGAVGNCRLWTGYPTQPG